MEKITQADIEARIARDNPWWADPNVALEERDFPRRTYFTPLKELALNFEVRRATIMLGPRRVGKTVMIRQLILDAISEGFNPRCILYASIDAPIYLGLSLEQFLGLFPDTEKQGQRIVIYDEIQYLKDWEVILKTSSTATPKSSSLRAGRLPPHSS